MEFNGQYLTYEEYRYLGGSLDLMPFNLLEFEARRIIDTRTLNRLKNIDTIPQEVKLCEYKLINSIKGYAETTHDIASKGNIKSENTDGYSIQYTNVSEISKIIESKNDEINDMVDTDLFGVIVNGEHLIYTGVDLC